MMILLQYIYMYVYGSTSIYLDLRVKKNTLNGHRSLSRIILRTYHSYFVYTLYHFVLFVGSAKSFALKIPRS